MVVKPVKSSTTVRFNALIAAIGAAVVAPDVVNVVTQVLPALAEITPEIAHWAPPWLVSALALVSTLGNLYLRIWKTSSALTFDPDKATVP